MRINQIIAELSDFAKQIGVDVRKDQGSFRSGLCHVKDKPVIVLNKRSSADQIAASIARSLAEMSVDNIYLKPALRELIDKEKQMMLRN